MARSRVGSEKAQQTLELPSELGRRPRGYVDKATECVNMERACIACLPSFLAEPALGEQTWFHII